MGGEYQDNPIGIDTQSPRFSWNYESKEHNTPPFRQRKYILRIAREKSELGTINSQAWISDTIYSNQTLAKDICQMKLEEHTPY